MRLSYARWLIRFAETYGIGLDPGELAEIKDATFRMRGLAVAHKPIQVTVESDVEMKTIEAWERPLLSAVASELRQSLDPNAQGNDDGLW